MTKSWEPWIECIPRARRGDAVWSDVTIEDARIILAKPPILHRRVSLRHCRIIYRGRYAFLRTPQSRNIDLVECVFMGGVKGLEP